MKLLVCQNYKRWSGADEYQFSIIYKNLAVRSGSLYEFNYRSVCDLIDGANDQLWNLSFEI
jgi:hypothetical protein